MHNSGRNYCVYIVYGEVDGTYKQPVRLVERRIAETRTRTRTMMLRFDARPQFTAQRRATSLSLLCSDQRDHRKLGCNAMRSIAPHLKRPRGVAFVRPPPPLPPRLLIVCFIL